MKGHYWGIVYVIAMVGIGVCYFKRLIDVQTAAGILASLTTFLLPSPVPIATAAQLTPGQIVAQK